MNYVLSITNPEALGVLEDICEELALPLSVTLHGRGTAVQSMLQGRCTPEGALEWMRSGLEALIRRDAKEG